MESFRILGEMKTYLEPEDIELMERAASCVRNRLLVRLLFRLGCRVSEVLALKVSDIDFERATVTILHLKTRIRLSCPMCKARLGKRHQFCPECGQGVSESKKRQQEHRRMRVLPIDKHTLEMLRDHIVRNQLALHSVHDSLMRVLRWRMVAVPRSKSMSLTLRDRASETRQPRRNKIMISSLSRRQPAACCINATSLGSK